MPIEALPRKKSIRAGHRSSITRALGQITADLESTPPDLDQLARRKLTLNEKLETLTKLDSEIIELTEDEGLENEIQQGKTSVWSGRSMRPWLASTKCLKSLLLLLLWPHPLHLLTEELKSNSQRSLYLTSMITWWNGQHFGTPTRQPSIITPS